MKKTILTLTAILLTLNGALTATAQDKDHQAPQAQVQIADPQQDVILDQRIPGPKIVTPMILSQAEIIHMADSTWLEDFWKKNGEEIMINIINGIIRNYYNS